MSAALKPRGNMTIVTSEDTPTRMLDDQHRECVVGDHSNAFYLRPEDDDRVYFDIHTAGQLLRCEAILQAFMEHGIHLWEYYDASIKKFEEGWDA